MSDRETNPACDWRVADRAVSMMALTHAIQNRILRATYTNGMTANVAREIASYASDLATQAARLAKETKSD